jgi:predicted DNA-binding transcriptional regulator AlpA
MGKAKTKVTTADVLMDDRPMIPLRQAAEAIGLSEWSAYETYKRGAFPVPVLRIGQRKLLVRRVDLLRFLGLTDAHDDDTQASV